MSVGFIHDPLEVKLLILYIAARVIEPLPLEGMQELSMCDDGFDYFTFSECLNDLLKTEHLSLSEEGKYSITPKGMRNSEICETSLPYSVRQRADRSITAYNEKLLRKAQVMAQVSHRDNGAFTVGLYLRDDVDSIMQLELMVATEEMAKDLAGRFEKNPEHLYARLIETLYGQDE